MPATRSEKPARRSQAERSAETKRKVIDAAVRCLATRGYAATTTTTVAVEAGVTRGAMFHQYPTKIDMILDIVRLNHDEGKRLFDAHLSGITDMRERFFRLPAVIWELGKRPAGIAMIEIMTGSRSDPELAERLGPIFEESEIADLAAIAGTLTNAGLNLPLDVPLARLVIAAVNGLVMTRALSSAPDDLDQSVERLCEVLEAYYKTIGGTPA